MPHFLKIHGIRFLSSVCCSWFWSEIPSLFPSVLAVDVSICNDSAAETLLLNGTCENVNNDRGEILLVSPEFGVVAGKVHSPTGVPFFRLIAHLWNATNIGYVNWHDTWFMAHLTKRSAIGWTINETNTNVGGSVRIDQTTIRSRFVDYCCVFSHMVFMTHSVLRR